MFFGGRLLLLIQDRLRHFSQFHLTQKTKENLIPHHSQEKDTHALGQQVHGD